MQRELFANQVENGGVAVVKLRAKDLSAPSSALPADQGAALQFQGWDGSSFETMATIFAATRRYRC